MASFSAAERRAIAAAVREGREPRCPVCDAPLSVQPVPAAKQTAYVRHRLWLLCPRCKRSGAVDVRGAGS